ncbi:histone-lysine N-methyltransferase, H3 lysine-9 specific SUVH4-like protein, partial [Tanacetum coccineum]
TGGGVVAGALLATKMVVAAKAFATEMGVEAKARFGEPKMWQRQRQKVGSDSKKDETVNFVKLPRFGEPKMWQRQRQKVGSDSKKDETVNFVKLPRMRAEDNEESKKSQSEVVEKSEQEYDDYEEEGGEYEEQGRRLGARPVKCENVAADEKESMPSKPEFCIKAGSVGNVARLINHSFDPNLFVQCVVSSHHDLKVALASDNIPPMQMMVLGWDSNVCCN